VFIECDYTEKSTHGRHNTPTATTLKPPDPSFGSVFLNWDLNINYAHTSIFRTKIKIATPTVSVYPFQLLCDAFILT
jgi:hypothetical protein